MNDFEIDPIAPNTGGMYTYRKPAGILDYMAISSCGTYTADSPHITFKDLSRFRVPRNRPEEFIQAFQQIYRVLEDLVETLGNQETFDSEWPISNTEDWVVRNGDGVRVKNNSDLYVLTVESYVYNGDGEKIEVANVLVNGDGDTVVNGDFATVYFDSNDSGTYVLHN